MPVVPVTNSMSGYNFTGDIEEEKIEFLHTIYISWSPKTKTKKENWAIISNSILGVKLYGKPYYFGNTGYPFPYLLEATNITKPIF